MRYKRLALLLVAAPAAVVAFAQAEAVGEVVYMDSVSVLAQASAGKRAVQDARRAVSEENNTVFSRQKTLRAIISDPGCIGVACVFYPAARCYS